MQIKIKNITVKFVGISIPKIINIKIVFDKINTAIAMLITIINHACIKLKTQQLEI